MTLLTMVSRSKKAAKKLLQVSNNWNFKDHLKTPTKILRLALVRLWKLAADRGRACRSLLEMLLAELLSEVLASPMFDVWSEQHSQVYLHRSALENELTGAGFWTNDLWAMWQLNVPPWLTIAGRLSLTSRKVFQRLYKLESENVETKYLSIN